MASALDYSTTAASNTAINGVGIAGNDLPSNLDNAMREMAANEANAQPRSNLKAGNYTAVKDDFGKTFVFSGAGRTLTISAISSLASGWNIFVEADASNALTIARSGSNTLNGAASLSLPAGYRCQIFVSNSGTDLKVDFASKVVPAGVSQGTTIGELNFPIGARVLMLGVYPAGFRPQRNSIVAPRLGESDHDYNDFSGSLLSGTWRARGAYAVAAGRYLIEAERVLA